MIRLIQKWLKAGVLEEEVVTVSDKCLSWKFLNRINHL